MSSELQSVIENLPQHVVMMLDTLGCQWFGFCPERCIVFLDLRVVNVFAIHLAKECLQIGGVDCEVSVVGGLTQFLGCYTCQVFRKEQITNLDEIVDFNWRCLRREYRFLTFSILADGFCPKRFGTLACLHADFREKGLGLVFVMRLTHPEARVEKLAALDVVGNKGFGATVADRLDARWYRCSTVFQ